MSLRHSLCFALVVMTAVACTRNGWGDKAVRCHIDDFDIGSIEGYTIDGSHRGVSFRLVPDVWAGSELRESDGRVELEDNPIHASALVVQEDPRNKTVSIRYQQRTNDGGVVARSAQMTCMRFDEDFKREPTSAAKSNSVFPEGSLERQPLKDALTSMGVVPGDAGWTRDGGM